MHPRQFSFLILSLLLIYFAASGVSAFDRPAVLVGNYRPIKNLNDPHLIEIAMFAVTEYNKEEGTDLEYMKIVRGESQVVAGINYRLVIAAKDGAYLGNYEAVVYERIWQHYRSLTSFKKLSALGSMVTTVGDACRRKMITKEAVRCIEMEDILPIFEEVADRLAKDMILSVESNVNVGPSTSDAIDFSAFLRPLLSLVRGFGGQVRVPIDKALIVAGVSYYEATKLLLLFYTNLFWQIDRCLKKMEQKLNVKSEGGMETFSRGCSQYLAILKDLHSISELYQGAEVLFWAMMRCRKCVVRALVVRYAKCTEDHKWFFDHKDVMDFQ